MRTILLAVPDAVRAQHDIPTGHLARLGVTLDGGTYDPMARETRYTLGIPEQVAPEAGLLLEPIRDACYAYAATEEANRNHAEHNRRMLEMVEQLRALQRRVVLAVALELDASATFSDQADLASQAIGVIRDALARDVLPLDHVTGYTVTR